MPMTRTSRHHRPADAESLLNVPEVAARLGVSPMTVYRLLDAGELTEHRIGKARRIAPADLAAYLAATRVTRGGTEAGE